MSEAGIGGPITATHLDTASIQFFGIELCLTLDGRLYVGIGATLCEQEGELTHVDLGDHRATTLDEALAFIRNTIKPVH